jgi:crotonobetainyl-CoA:carnitine CoA-transferase CaiB-like acyl-CoA transferase
MQRPDLTSDARYATIGARRDNLATLDLAIVAWTRTHAAAEVESVLQAAGVRAAVVATAEDVVQHDIHLHERGFWQYLNHSVMGRTLYHGIPAHFSQMDTAYRHPAPLLGEHNDELPALVGLSPDEMESLRKAGALL